MGLLRRGKQEPNATSPNPTPQDSGAGAPPPDDNATSSAASNPISRLWKWLQDSYNGLYVIVLKPRMPKTITIIQLVLGLVIGLIWGYSIRPVVFNGANPNRLSEAAQNQWVRMIAVGYDPSARYGEEEARLLLNQIDSPAQRIERQIAALPETTADGTPNADRAALQTLAPLAEGLRGTPTPQSPGFLSDLFDLLLPILGIIIITPIVVLLWRFLIYDNLVAPVIERFKEARNPEYRAQREKERASLKVMQEQKKLVDELKKQTVADVELGNPVMQSLSIFNKGRSYDDSIEIELPLDQGGDFLGQCGAVLAEAVDPDPVAVEVWLFDMFSQQNLRKVFITEAGYNDPKIRSRIEDDVDDAADIVVAAPNATVTIDSDKLRLQGKMLTVNVGEDGRFQDFKIQIQAWQKGKKSATPLAAPAPVIASAPMPPPIPDPKPLPSYDDMKFDAPPPMPPRSAPPPPPTTARPLSDYDDIQFDPPPIPARSAPPPPMPMAGMSEETAPNSPPPRPIQPLRPPTLPPADDDDPFGGTGDFTPIPR